MVGALFDSAEKVLSLIPKKYSLSEEEWQDYETMESIYYTVMKSSLTDLSEDELKDLIEIADTNIGRACYLAREVLAHYDILYPPIWEVPSGKSDNTGKPETTQKMAVSPNPTDYNVTFDWSEFDVKGEVLIEISSMTGGLIDILKPASDSYKMEWTTEKVSGNACHYRLLVNGMELDSGQIIINK